MTHYFYNNLPNTRIIKQVILKILLYFLIVSCNQNTSKEKTIIPKDVHDKNEKRQLLDKKDSIAPKSTQKLKKTILSRKKPAKKKPTSVQKFSLRDLTFTWEEINACDCLFMVKADNMSYEKLYFGRFKGDTSGIIQLGKNNKKQLIPLTRSRSKNRKPGSFWREIYQNNNYKIQLKANATTPKVKGKFTYYIEFILTDLTAKKVLKNIILANCKS